MDLGQIKECVYKGVNKEGILPGGLNVVRRAAKLNKTLLKGKTYANLDEWFELIVNSENNFVDINKWISCFALTVNEENASFGRIITAPTNGASGIIPRSEERRVGKECRSRCWRVDEK